MKIQIPPTGPINSPIAIVGLMPYKKDLESRTPFTSWNGWELNSWLKATKIQRNDTYLTTVVKRLVTDKRGTEDISKLIRIKGQKTYASKEYLEWEEQLYEELNGISASIVVALGKEALWTLTRRYGIEAWRGSVLWSEKLGKKVIATLDPADTVRWDFKKRLWAVRDFQRAKQESRFTEMKKSRYSYLLRPSFEETIKFLDECLKKKRVGFDIEVIPRKEWEISCLSFAYKKPREDFLEYPYAISIPFVQNNYDDYWTKQNELVIWDKIAELLESKKVTKITQNGSFDSEFVFARYGIRTAPMQDTMIAGGILEPDYPKSLAFLTSVYTEEPYYKDTGKKNFENIRDDYEFWLYSAKDAAVLLEIFEKELINLGAMGRTDAYQAQNLLVEPLVFAQRRGVKVDTVGVTNEAKIVIGEIAQMQSELNELAGRQLNYASDRQLKDYFYGVLGHPPFKNSKGKPTTDATAMRRLFSKYGLEEARLVRELKEHKKYLEILQKDFRPDDRLRCSFNPIGTVSGRLSSSQDIFGRGTNMQNLPKRFRKYMLADEEYKIYEVDLGGAEDRIVAYCGPVEEKIRAFENGEDVHSLTAGALFGIPTNEVSRKKGSWIRDESQRDAGKKTNHGANYGIGGEKFALKNELSYAMGKAFIKAHHEKYPGIRQGYHAWIIEKLKLDATLKNCSHVPGGGKTRTFRDRTRGRGTLKNSYKTYMTAFDWFAQSTVADIINRGIVWLYNGYDEEGRVDEAEFLTQGHDSIVFQIPLDVDEERHMEILRGLKEVLESTMYFTNPVTGEEVRFVIPAEFAGGVKWGEMEEIEV